ncbi:hypothetical protein OG458_42940 (plasmid) [Streptomyces sp. NBC_01281]|uniref:hypothetical protein n=1 Tax=Streptomyces sp. NBC_01281 TaxID=2903811 RepID=UPI002E0FAC3F|nr:hypothetical protein OG458_42940 [Streptomyces sp. NBC_01281]
MPDTWITLDAAARRKNWWWTAYLTAIFGGLAVAVSAVGEPFWWAIYIGTFWLISVIYMINRGYGRTLLTTDRMIFRTFFSRRSIPWTEVSDIEKRRHQGRSAEWWELRVTRKNGRPLSIPGAFANRRHDSVFENKLALIQEYKARSTPAE